MIIMEKCRLCQIKNKELKKSHIIPKMFFNILAKLFKMVIKFHFYVVNVKIYLVNMKNFFLIIYIKVL